MTGRDEHKTQSADSAAPATTLRRGWTTGACATAATKAAVLGLLTGEAPDPVEIVLPKGQRVGFALNTEDIRAGDWATVSIIKDAGDDPDVTHGAVIAAKVEPGTPGQGVRLCAGEGVGVVTREGLPIDVGEASITPVPRRMIREAATEVAQSLGVAPDFTVTFSIEGGEALALETLNPRLGIVGGLSILGTTGIVIPYSCSSWIHSIHRGIDVAKAAGVTHVIASTGNTSEDAANAVLGLPEIALLDMGDFAGGVLKYLKTHPIPRLTIAGGPGKLSKLAQGHMDLHSSRTPIDLAWLIAQLDDGQKTSIPDDLTSVAQLVALLPSVNQVIADLARQSAQAVVGDGIEVDVMLFDRRGKSLAKAGPYS